MKKLIFSLLFIGLFLSCKDVEVTKIEGKSPNAVHDIDGHNHDHKEEEKHDHEEHGDDHGSGADSHDHDHTDKDDHSEEEKHDHEEHGGDHGDEEDDHDHTDKDDDSEEEKHDHDKHGDDHGGEEGDHDHGSSKAIGVGKAIVDVDEEKGFKLSKEAIKTLNLKFSKAENGLIQINENSLVRGKNFKGLYKYTKGYFKLIPATVISKNGHFFSVEISDLSIGDQIVVGDASLLRVADIYSTDKSEYGHSH